MNAVPVFQPPHLSKMARGVQFEGRVRGAKLRAEQSFTLAVEPAREEIVPIVTPDQNAWRASAGRRCHRE